MNADKQALPTRLYSAGRIRQQEPLIAQQLGLDLYQVMESAGLAAWQCLKRHWPGAQRILVVTGRGNNGGDGYVLARRAMAEGCAVSLVQVASERPLKGDALKAQAAYLVAGGQFQSAEAPWPEADVLVDAVLGTGLSGPLNDEMAHLVERINAYPAPVLALDIPSGVQGNTGTVDRRAVQAEVTLTFVGAKPELLTAAAPLHTGWLELAPLELGEALFRLPPCAVKTALSDYREKLLPRHPTSHKGDHGRLLIVGGALGMGGAVRLAAEGALRSGVGLVCACTEVANLAVIQAGRPEIMLAEEEQLAEKADWASVRLLGPGLGTDTRAQRLWQATLAYDGPLVMDADGLNLLARSPRKRDNWILTPHPGEAARLLDCASAEVEADRFAAVKALQSRYGGVVVLKGAGTLIANGKSIVVAPVGNPGLACGGSGDLLSGIIAGLLAQGLRLADAAGCGVCLHGDAADRAARRGQRGMLASDLLPHLRTLVNPD